MKRLENPGLAGARKFESKSFPQAIRGKSLQANSLIYSEKIKASTSLFPFLQFEFYLFLFQGSFQQRIYCFPPDIFPFQAFCLRVSQNHKRIPSAFYQPSSCSLSPYQFFSFIWGCCSSFSPKLIPSSPFESRLLPQASRKHSFLQYNGGLTRRFHGRVKDNSNRNTFNTELTCLES